MHAQLREQLRALMRQAPTEDVMSELVRRTVANQDMEASPRALLELVCIMSSMLDAQQCFLVSEALRNAADELENLDAPVQ